MYTHLCFVLLLAAQLIFFSRIEAEDNSRNRNKRSIKTANVFTSNEITAAVKEHNDARSNVQPQAANMLKMSWSKELEYMAVNYSRRCIYKHSSGRNTKDFSWIGENLYLQSNEEDVATVIKGAIKSWDNERKDYNFEQNTCSGVCGHYTQVVWASSYVVGCGVTTCSNIQVDSKLWETGQLVVCNYGPGGNYRDTRPYEKGLKCSKCPDSAECLCGEGNLLSGSYSFVLFSACLVLLVNIIAL